MSRWIIGVATAVVACQPPPTPDLVFVNGRAVAAAGDSLLAYTVSGTSGFVVTDRRGNVRDTLGVGLLTSPVHVQEHDGRWYVSDVVEGRARIVEIAADGRLIRRHEIDSLTSTPHQFAILPDGHIVLEAPNGTLVSVGGDRATTFAVVAESERTGLLAGARGGVLHALPGQWVTLYNANGNIRWRLGWPWSDNAFVSDLAVDVQGRPHVLAGEQGRAVFVIFSLSPVTGEIVRWSEPGPAATFAVRRMGDIEPIPR